MPGKSRRSKGRPPHHSKKSRARLHSSAIPVTLSTAGTPEPAAAVTLPPASSKSTPMVKPKTAQHPYIAAELRVIGILAGIILIILIVLALVLS